MSRIIAFLKAAASRAWNFMADPKSKNALLFILLVMTAFGMVAPDAATSMRDTIIAFAF